jgi:hypothetical protein
MKTRAKELRRDPAKNRLDVALKDELIPDCPGIGEIRERSSES